jgi:hypothetical protein
MMTTMTRVFNDLLCTVAPQTRKDEEIFNSAHTRWSLRLTGCDFSFSQLQAELLYVLKFSVWLYRKIVLFDEVYTLPVSDVAF